MAELPTVGADEAAWGSKVNAYLRVGHAADGTHDQAGMVAQVVNVQTGSVGTGTTKVPADDTIPQITEGDQYMTLAITPKSATNKLKIEVTLIGANTAAGAILGVGLFQDTTVNALAAGAYTGQVGGNQMGTVSFVHWMTSGTTSSTTFRIRAGGHLTGTTTFNGLSSARKYGGVMASSITITEILV